MRQDSTVLQNFEIVRPQFEMNQAQALQWLGNSHAQAEKWKNPGSDLDSDRLIRLFHRYGCNPTRIGKRGTELNDILETDLRQMKIFGPDHVSDQQTGVTRSQSGVGISIRSQLFETVSNIRIRELFREESRAPSHLIHVTCTGYISPSAAQTLISERQWNQHTQITHAYHMGCYASLPAIRIADGFRAAGLERTEIVHTELCSLHLDLSNHSPEQMVVQSLFGDGHIRYSAVNSNSSPLMGLEVIAIHEEILPNTLDLMTWRISEWGMKMTLSTDVPKQISQSIRGLIERMMSRVGSIESGFSTDSRFMSESIFAIHPGGPRIIDQLQNELDLREEQVSHSKAVLYSYGNMSSATLPHIWKAILEDPNIPEGRWIISLAFGPGLTAVGSLMRKRCS